MFKNFLASFVESIRKLCKINVLEGKKVRMASPGMHNALVELLPQ